MQSPANQNREEELKRGEAGKGEENKAIERKPIAL